MAARVDARGEVLDRTPIPVATLNGAQQRPAVSSDGENFLVVWQDFRNGNDWDVYGARVSAQGEVLDRDGRLLAGGEHNQCLPDVVYGAGSYYVAWLDMRHFPEYRVFGARVSAAGKPLDRNGVQLLRVMSDKQIAAWRIAPFAPGKKGSGWHQYMQQPGPPELEHEWQCPPRH